MSKLKVEERRRFVRARRRMQVEHKLHHRNNRPVVDRWHWALSHDMSYGGVLFSTDAFYQKGDVLDIRVTFAGSIEVLKGLARVVRAHPQKDGFFAVAVALLFLENYSPGKNRLKNKKC